MKKSCIFDTHASVHCMLCDDFVLYVSDMYQRYNTMKSPVEFWLCTVTLSSVHFSNEDSVDLAHILDKVNHT